MGRLRHDCHRLASWLRSRLPAAPDAALFPDAIQPPIACVLRFPSARSTLATVSPVILAIQTDPEKRLLAEEKIHAACEVRRRAVGNTTRYRRDADPGKPATGRRWTGQWR